MQLQLCQALLTSGSLHLPPSQGTTLPGMGGSVSLSKRQPPALAIPSTWICFSLRASALFIGASLSCPMLKPCCLSKHMVLMCLNMLLAPLWCWGRLLRVPWTARRSNQSVLKEINPEYSSEGQMLKPKVQYFSHLMRRANSLEKTLMLGKTEGRRRSGGRRMRWLDGITNSMNTSLSNSRR